MIVVSGTISVDASDHDAAAGLMRTLAAATNQEAGCVGYGFYADLSEPGSFRVFEEWQDEDALNSHMREPHMAEFMAGLGGLTMTGSSLTRYDVGGTSKLM